jgi:hypothetical protein
LLDSNDHLVALANGCGTSCGRKGNACCGNASALTYSVSPSAPNSESTRVLSIVPFADAIERAACALSRAKPRFCPYPDCPADTELLDHKLGELSQGTSTTAPDLTPIRLTYWPRRGAAVSGEKSTIVVVVAGTIEFNATSRCVWKAPLGAVEPKVIARTGIRGKLPRRRVASAPRRRRPTSPSSSVASAPRGVSGRGTSYGPRRGADKH